MVEKPELIIFSQNKIGGVQNFYWNILSNDPYDHFKKLWIFTDSEDDKDTKLPSRYNCTKEEIFFIRSGENTYEYSARLERLVSDAPGVVLTNFPVELSTLHLHRRNNKTIFFLCHDQEYFEAAKKFEFLIDVFVAHNFSIYEDLKNTFPNRRNDVYYLPYGVFIPSAIRNENTDQQLTITLISRLHKLKGIYDLPLIDDLLQQRNIDVNWKIVGMGPEKENFSSLLKQKSNFSFYSPSLDEGVIPHAQGSDIFMLPSRLDGLPVALLEAMSVGCVPVISEFNAGIKKVVTEQEGFVLPVGDIRAFADVLEKLHYDRILLERCSSNARMKIVKEYDIIVRAKAYFDLFDQYVTLKKKSRRKFIAYNGILEHPAIPTWLKKGLRMIKPGIKAI